MIKKKPKMSSQYLLSSKDKKSLKKQLNSQYNTRTLDSLFSSQTEIFVQKFNNPKMNIYLYEQMPIFVQVESDFFPSLQLVQQHNFLEILEIHEHVDMYLKKGAKLMWPGVKKIKNDAKKDEIFAIKMGENIIGVGVFLGDIENREGPCLACLQVEGDWLCQEGDMIQIKLTMENENDETNYQNQVQNQDENQEQNQDLNQETNELAEEINNLNIDNQQLKEPKISQELKTEIEQDTEKNEEITKDQMDKYIMESFLNAVKLSPGIQELPMDISNVYSNHMLPYKPVSFNLDMKHSSYKKTGQFFKVLQKQGLVDYKEAKKNSNPVITRINFQHPSVLQWIPTMNEVKQKNNKIEEEDSEYPKIQIKDIYRIQKKFKPIFDMSNEDNFAYSLEQIKSMMTHYIQENTQQDSKYIIYDPVMANIFVKPDDEDKTKITKNLFFGERLDQVLVHCHQIINLETKKVLIRQGKFEGITLLGEKSNNKNVTKIRGLEQFLIPMEELTEKFKKRFSSSCGIMDLPGHTILKVKEFMQEVQVQGNFLIEIQDALEKEYKMESRFIHVINKLPKKKK